MKWTDIFVSIFLIWLIQLLFADLLSIGTIRPDFPLILILYLSIIYGRFIGILCGFLLGLLVDLSGTALFFGLLPLTYSITGYLAGNLKDTYNKISPLLFSLSWVSIILFQFFIFCIVQYQYLWVTNKNIFFGKLFGTCIYTIAFVTILQFLYPIHRNN